MKRVLWFFLKQPSSNKKNIYLGYLSNYWVLKAVILKQKTTLKMKKLFLLFALFGALTFTTACGGGETATEETEDTTATEEEAPAEEETTTEEEMPADTTAADSTAADTTSAE
ncbi:MAG: hypothetical protein NW226_03825 [Microscillaceae bacterium]|nr:hypothetical protein [Microscillaceae bacterium]